MGHSPELGAESRSGVVLRDLDLNIRHEDVEPTDIFQCFFFFF